MTRSSVAGARMFGKMRSSMLHFQFCGAQLFSFSASSSIHFEPLEALPFPPPGFLSTRSTRNSVKPVLAEWCWRSPC